MTLNHYTRELCLRQEHAQGSESFLPCNKQSQLCSFAASAFTSGALPSSLALQPSLDGSQPLGRKIVLDTGMPLLPELSFISIQWSHILGLGNISVVQGGHSPVKVLCNAEV